VRPLDSRRVLRAIGRRIAELRRDRAMTQESFAEELDVSVRYVQYIESGTENLTIETLVQLANCLRVGIADLVAAPSTSRARRGRPKVTAKRST